MKPEGVVGQLVTAEDLKPSGWKCEACGHDFQIGDEVIGNILAYSGITEREMEVHVQPEDRADLTDNDIPIYGDFRCRECWDADRPVREDGKRLKPDGWKPPDIAGLLALVEAHDGFVEVHEQYCAAIDGDPCDCAKGAR